MPRPNVTVTINDQSFVTVNSESATPHISGLYTDTTDFLVEAVGSTFERQRGYIEVNTISDWFGRLKSSLPVGANLTGGSDFTAGPFAHYVGATGTAGNNFAGGTFERWPYGPTGSWAPAWWAAHNYLLYGGTLVIGATGTQTHKTENALYDKLVYLDSVFGYTAGDNDKIDDIVYERDDCVGILSISSGVTPDSEMEGWLPNLTGGVSGGTADGSKIFNVYGEKIHLNIERLSTDFVSDTNLVTTTLAADVAGCFARTDSVAAPWYSPAGAVRGRILDVIRLTTQLTDSEQDNLYSDNNRVNPVVTFGGEGTFLFGDKTREAQTSTLSRINVSRLFIYLQKTLGRIARTVLFEQNDSTTRSKFVNQVTQVLESVKSRRGVTDYKVICDESNNTPDLIDANTFVADVFVKPTKSINYVRLRFTNKNESADLS